MSRRAGAATDGPRILERRPSALSLQVDDLLGDVASGKLRLPDFQRPQRWEHEDRRQLLDSIFRGYPVGTLLLWSRPAPAGVVVWGDYSIKAREQPAALWVVDGQQRISALASTLLPPQGETKRIANFDLEKQSFVYGPIAWDADDAQTKFVGAYRLYDANLLIRWASGHKDTPEDLVSRAIDCGKRLREYQLPAYEVATTEEDILRTIFRRLNRSGKRLEEVDVFDALFTSVRSGERYDVKTVAQRLAERPFGGPSADVILSAYRAMHDLPIDKEFLDEVPAKEVPRGLRRTAAALERVIEFLVNEGRMLHAALVPYTLPFVVLARFFDRFPEASQRNRTLLRRWLWRASLGGRLSGASGSLRQHVAVVGDDEDESVQGLLSLHPRMTDENFDSLSKFNPHGARTRLELCALAALRPRHLETGELLDVAAVVSSEPSAATKKLVQTDADIGGTLANRIFHPYAAPSLLRRWLLEADADTLESHGIRDRAHRAIATSQDDAFLRLRERRLVRHLASFFRARAEYGADDSPPVSSVEDVG
jgi:hypothetical protein